MIKNNKQSVSGFWKDLPKGFSCLAPMADVTDVAFRRMFAKHGRPDIMWTEFVSADGLFLRPIIRGSGDQPKNKHQEILLKHGVSSDHPLGKDLLFDDSERPIIAQFFSRDPERMKRAAALAHELGYDGVDINMGCPADVICKQGAGSAMIKDPVLAQEIIQAAIEGAGDIPVSVKTRIGFNKNELETWLPNLLEANPVAVIIHARTRKEMSKVPAQWEQITRAVQIRNEIAPEILIVGNGDVGSMDGLQSRIIETGCDGVMVGRGIFGDPWFFNIKNPKSSQSKQSVLNALVEHIELYDHYLGSTKSFAVMKKHFKAYIRDIAEINPLKAKEMYMRLMQEPKTAVETIEIIKSWM